MEDLPSIPSNTPWPLAWLTPTRCRIIFATLVIFGFFSHLSYLRNNCPIDLSGDEAQYWDWSRQLDICYYSKGPLIAWIIRAGTAIFGHEMWAVRLPALLLAAAISCLTYWLTLRLFKSDRLALGVILLNHLVPMFVAGSMLMTIDPPYFFCWGLATAFLALAVLDDKPWAWCGVGIAIGIGALAKYGMLLWPIGMFIFLILDRATLHPQDSTGQNIKKSLVRPGPWLAIVIGLAFLTLPILWNARHDWVSFKHVAHQTGATKKTFDGNFLELLLGQIAILGPALTPLLIGAVILAWRGKATNESAFPPTTDNGPLTTDPPQHSLRAATLLLWTGLPLFALCLVTSLFAKVQINWPAAAYFSWMILTAWFISTRMQSLQSWKRWRGWLWGAIVFGLVMMPIAHNFEHLYPLLPALNKLRKNPIDARDFDPTAKLKGWKELGRRVSTELAQLNRPFIIGRDYMIAAELAFYVDGHPRTFCIGPYAADPKKRARWTQYDIWPDRRLDQPELLGRDAIFVGYPIPDLQRAFEKVEQLPDFQLHRQNSLVRRFQIYRCTNFKGLNLPEAVTH